MGRRFEPVWAHSFWHFLFKFQIYTLVMLRPNTWLITGGAGYIGAHIADAFLDDGKTVIIYDSLYRGLESRIEYLRKKHKQEIPLIVADIRDTETFRAALELYKPEGVIHTAALKSVRESIEKPDEYFEVNFYATKELIEAISSYDIHRFIFSSTAAVYGSPIHSNPVKESDSKNPISPYGSSKLAAETEVVKYLECEGNFGVSLRFFNVVGAAALELLDNSEENLVPIVMKKLKSGQAPDIFGTDYPTADGTCVRDYVDVRDVARAHLLAAKSSWRLPHSLNVGTGKGASVREVIRTVSQYLGQTSVAEIESGRRLGDPASLVGEVSLIESSLHFKSQYSLSEGIKSLF